MSVEGVLASEALAEHVHEAAEVLRGSNWFVPPGAYSLKNCDVIACKSCGSETFVLKRHYASGYLCSTCVQANSYA